MARLRIGLSTQTTETAISGGRSGITTYTAALQAHLPAAGLLVEGIVFPPLRHPLPTLSHSRYVGPPYALNVGLDLCGFPKVTDCAVDVVHYTDYRIAPAKQPIVATLHDAIPLKFPEWVSPRWRAAKNLVMKRMARHADRIVAVSSYAVPEISEHFGIKPDRITVIPCGIEATWLQKRNEATVPHLTARDGRPLQQYFLFVGMLQPRKNVDRIIDAYLSLERASRQSHPLVIVGRHGWRCEHTAQRLRLLISQGANIYWLENIAARGQLRDIYHHALGLVFPSLYEGFGIPVLEAFASNIPVITSVASSLPEVAGDAAILIDPYDTDAIKNAMQTLVADAGLRKELAKKGQARVREYTWDKSAQQLSRLYHSLG